VERRLAFNRSLPSSTGYTPSFDRRIRVKEPGDSVRQITEPNPSAHKSLGVGRRRSCVSEGGSYLIHLTLEGMICRILICALVATRSLAFVPTFSVVSTSPAITLQKAKALLSEDAIITPDGFGFSAPAQRVLKEANRGTGFYKASADETVIDVMEAITTNEKDVALVYAANQLLGLFTEADYVRVSLHLLV